MPPLIQDLSPSTTPSHTAPSPPTPPTSTEADAEASDVSSVVSSSDSSASDSDSDPEPHPAPRLDAPSYPPSSDADSDSDSESITITTTRPPRELPQRSALLGQLRAFLPKLKAANEELVTAQEQGSGFERVVQEGEETEVKEGQYVEMDLGLGVLEEKGGDEEEEQEEGSAPMDKLMGREKDEEEGKKVEIQEV